MTGGKAVAEGQRKEHAERRATFRLSIEQPCEKQRLGRRLGPADRLAAAYHVAKIERLPIEFIDARALHLGIEHFQRSAAGVDLIVMGEIGEAFEDAEQLFVPRSPPDLHIAGTALRTEWPEPG